MDDVGSLTKEEFLKFLNCADQKNLPINNKYLVKNKRNQSITLIEKSGTYLADKVKIEESSLNNKVLRIPLPVVENLKDLSLRKAQTTFKPQASTFRTFTNRRQKPNTSSFGRKIKKKQFFEDKPKNKATKQQSKYSKPVAKVLKPKPTLKPIERKKYSSSESESNKETAFEYFDYKRKISKTKVTDMEAPMNSADWSALLSQTDETYFLKFNPIKHPEDGKLKYPFEVLVKDIKNMKLPSASWRIKVIVRNSKISSIIFTNKCVIERTVTFTAKTERYEIVIENRPAILLGSPGVMECIEDIEILLDIIHTISAKSPMVFYKD